MDPERLLLLIQPSDFLIPMCHEGVNRSQILYLALVGLLRRAQPDLDEVRVAVPHGAEGGFDPHPPAEAPLTEDTAFNYINGIVRPRDPADTSQWVRAVPVQFVVG